MIVFYVLTICFLSAFADSSESSDSDEGITDCDNIDSYKNEIFSSKLCGDLILPTDGDAYLAAATDQFAALSFPERIKPSMIVEAGCDEDIKSAINYAKQCDFTIVVRSGGHQFSGLSSCSDSCIQIDMVQYNEIVINNENNIVVEVGVELGDLYQVLHENDLFLPSGDINQIGIGGHVQTGGVGHELRSHGILLDYVDAFGIILSDGTTHEITKPDANNNCNDNKFNDDLYWAMGGNPGSFGVITHFQFHANKNADSSTSTIYQCVWEYNEAVLRVLLNGLMEVQADERYLSSSQYSFWWLLRKQQPFGTNVMVIECLWGGRNDEAYDSTICDEIFDPALAINSALSCQTIPKLLSEAHIDVWSYDSPQGKTYRAQNRFSAINLTPQFINQWVNALDEIYLDESNGLFPVQLIISGGGDGSVAFQNDPDSTITAFPQRRMNYLFDVADVIYYVEAMNENAKQTAIDWLENTWSTILDSKSFNNGIDLRENWLTFGNLNIEQVWQYYYTSEIYQRLKEIKTRVDGINLFKNAFTIPPIQYDSSSSSSSSDDDALINEENKSDGMYDINGSNQWHGMIQIILIVLLCLIAIG